MAAAVTIALVEVLHASAKLYLDCQQYQFSSIFPTSPCLIFGVEAPIGQRFKGYYRY